jgi:hypothetical protein
MQADTQHSAGFSEPPIEYAVILAQILLEDRCGLAGLAIAPRPAAHRRRRSPARPRLQSGAQLAHSVLPARHRGTGRAESHDQQVGARYGGSAGCGTAERLNMVRIAKEND